MQDLPDGPAPGHVPDVRPWQRRLRLRGAPVSALTVIFWSAISATLVWGITLRRASAAIAAERAAAAREVRHWADQAARARARADQLERELASWSEGCRQGREDVVSIMPMLLAAQGHHTCLPQTGTDGAT